MPSIHKRVQQLRARAMQLRANADKMEAEAFTLESSPPPPRMPATLVDKVEHTHALSSCWGGIRMRMAGQCPGCGYGLYREVPLSGIRGVCQECKMRHRWPGYKREQWEEMGGDESKVKLGHERLRIAQDRKESQSP